VKRSVEEIQDAVRFTLSLHGTIGLRGLQKAMEYMGRDGDRVNVENTKRAALRELGEEGYKVLGWSRPE
jgi:hypothetical protein